MPQKRETTKKGSTGVTFDAVCKMAAKLPRVVESTSYGTRALKVGKASFVRLKEDGKTIVLKTDLVSRDYMMREQPDVFYITDHYREYPWVLVRLGAVRRDQMQELLTYAWELVAKKPK